MRLVLIEHLGQQSREELSVVLVSPTPDQSVVRYGSPVNQAEALGVIRFETLSCAEFDERHGSLARLCGWGPQGCLLRLSEKSAPSVLVRFAGQMTGGTAASA